MEAGFVTLAILIVIVSIVVGIHIERIRVKRHDAKNVQGVLNVICSDCEPQLFLQLEVPIEDVIARERVILDVNVIQ